MVSLFIGFWKLQWSIAGICERDSFDVYFFLSGKGVALGGQLCFLYHPELEMDYSMYRKNECHVERGCGSLYPLGGTT